MQSSSYATKNLDGDISGTKKGIIDPLVSKLTETRQKIYGLYARKYHIVQMRGDVTDAGRTTNEQ